MHLPFSLFRREADSPTNSSSTLTLKLNGTTTDSSTPTTASHSPSSTPPPNNSDSNTPSVIIPIAVAVASVIVLILLFFLLKYLRQNHENPKYIPTSFLKRKWSSWKPSTGGYRSTNSHLEPISEQSGTGRSARNRQPPSSFNTATTDAVRRAENGDAAGVDRNTSVRSVMTLPPYNPKPGETEQVLGREGERGGIDVVVEYPETVDEEERRRDEEMEALYQVRLARRTEAAEREERRRLRREARDRNDRVALEELRTRARAASGASGERTLEELREEHARIRDRQRAVSSVSYAELGVARHDGTRLRANSEESERPLLGDAASLASSHHRRDRSASSVLSIDSDLPSAGLSRRRADSHLSERRGSGQMSSPEMIDREEADEDTPQHSPPEYETIALDDAQEHAHHNEAPPDYHSPIDRRAPGLPEVESNEERDTVPGLSADSSVERRSSRGVGGVPQLPSLRLASLPSIVVNTPTPVDPRQSGERSRSRSRENV